MQEFVTKDILKCFFTSHLICLRKTLDHTDILAALIFVNIEADWPGPRSRAYCKREQKCLGVLGVACRPWCALSSYCFNCQPCIEALETKAAAPSFSLPLGHYRAAIIFLGSPEPCLWDLLSTAPHDGSPGGQGNLHGWCKAKVCKSVKAPLNNVYSAVYGCVPAAFPTSALQRKKSREHVSTICSTLRV